MTFIGKPQTKEYSFQYTELPNKVPEPITILDVLNKHKEFDMVSVHGKITKLLEPAIVGKKKSPPCWGCSDGPYQSIALDMFEEHINQVKNGETYNLANIQVKVWSSKKKLSTVRQTKISTTETASLNNIAVEETNCADDSERQTTIIKEILAVEQVSKHWQCLRCNKKKKYHNRQHPMSNVAQDVD